MEGVILIALLLVAGGLVFFSLRPNKSEIVAKISRRTAGLDADQDATAIKAKAQQAVASRFMDAAAPFLSKPVMPKDAAQQSNLRAKLAAAGYRRESAFISFLASKIIVGVIMGMLGVTYTLMTESTAKESMFYGILGLGAGFMLPNLWLANAAKKRGQAVREGLPDSLDLMVVAVEAGLGLDAALQRVSDEMSNVHVALSEEVQIAVVETQMGVPRGAALTKMAARTGVQEMRALVAVIVQAEKLGTSIAKALRNQAESLRTKRRQAAEERAQKTAVKLLIPLILFIFPAIFVVLAGPAAIHLMKTFSDGGISTH